MTANETKRKLIDAGLVLAHLGFGDMTRGHVSVRVPGETELFFMKAHGIGLDEITMDNILTIDLAGNVLAGQARRHSEVYIHSELYRARPDLNAVVHAHPKYAVAFSATGRSIRPISQGGAMFMDAVGRYEDTIDLIRTPGMGRDVAAAAGPHKTVLLKHHGIVTAGDNLEEAVIRLYLLENALEIQLIAEAAGELAPEFPRDQILTVQRNFNEPRQFPVNFDYLVRRARRPAVAGL